MGALVCIRKLAPYNFERGEPFCGVFRDACPSPLLRPARCTGRCRGAAWPLRQLLCLELELAGLVTSPRRATPPAPHAPVTPSPLPARVGRTAQRGPAVAVLARGVEADESPPRRGPRGPAPPRAQSEAAPRPGGRPRPAPGWHLDGTSMALVIGHRPTSPLSCQGAQRNAEKNIHCPREH